jgi:hypothetical protein
MLGPGIFNLLALTLAVIIQSITAANPQTNPDMLLPKKLGRVIPQLPDLTCSYSPGTPQHCYSFNFHQLLTKTVHENDCYWSYCIEARFPELKIFAKPENMTLARQKLETPTCDTNPYCYACCGKGVCLDAGFCASEYSVLDNWVGFLILTLILMKIVGAGLLVFYALGLRKDVEFLKFKAKEYMASIGSLFESSAGGGSVEGG